MKYRVCEIELTMDDNMYENIKRSYCDECAYYGTWCCDECKRNDSISDKYKYEDHWKEI